MKIKSTIVKTIGYLSFSVSLIFLWLLALVHSFIGLSEVWVSLQQFFFNFSILSRLPAVFLLNQVQPLFAFSHEQVFDFPHFGQVHLQVSIQVRGFQRRSFSQSEQHTVGGACNFLVSEKFFCSRSVSQATSPRK